MLEAPPTEARYRTPAHSVIDQKSVGAEKHDTPLKKGLSSADLELLANLQAEPKQQAPVMESDMVDGTKSKSHERPVGVEDRKLLVARPRHPDRYRSKSVVLEVPPTEARYRTPAHSVIDQKSVGAEKHDTPLKKGLSSADLELLANLQVESKQPAPVIESDRRPARRVKPDPARHVARQVEDVMSRAYVPRTTAPVASEILLPEAPTFDPCEDTRRVRDLEEQNDRLLKAVRYQHEQRQELEQHRAALTNRLRAKTEQHAAAVAEVERAQDVIGALQARPTSKPVKEYKIAQYNLGMDWSIWAATFRAVAYMNQWSEEESAFRLRLSLAPKALELAEGTSEALTEVLYPDVMGALSKIFVPTDKVHKAGTDFELRKKKPKESWQDYALDLIKLYKINNPGEIDIKGERAISRQFIRGCGDKELALYPWW